MYRFNPKNKVVPIKMIGEIQPPLDLIRQRPEVLSIRFSFDFVDAPLSKRSK